MAPTSCSSSSGTIAPGADLVDVVVGGEAGLGLAVQRAGDVDGDVVAVLDGAVDLDEGAVHLAQAVDLGVDLVLVDRGALDGDRQAAVAGHLDGGAHLDDGVEGDVARLLAAGDVDLGRGDDVDVVLDHRLRVVLGERVLQRLLAADVRARGGPRGSCGAPCRAGSPGCGPPGRSS